MNAIKTITNKLWLKFFLSFVIVLFLVISIGDFFYERNFSQRMKDEYLDRGIQLVNRLTSEIQKKMQPLVPTGVNDLQIIAESSQTKEVLAEVISGITTSSQIIFVSLHGKDGNPISGLGSGELNITKSLDWLTIEKNTKLYSPHIEKGKSDEGIPLLILTKAILLNSEEVDDTSWLFGEESQEQKQKTAGFVCLGFSLAQMKSAIKENRRNGFVISLALAFLSSCVVYLLVRRMLTPIRLLSSATQIVASGNFEHQVDVKGKDEVGFLARSFNEMTEKLKQSQAEQERLQQQVVESAYQSGLAEMSGTILHNIGNVLTGAHGNLINIQDILLGGKVGVCKAKGDNANLPFLKTLHDLKTVLAEKEETIGLAKFFETDEKSEQVLPILDSILETANSTIERLKHAENSIAESFRHISEIIRTEQSYRKGGIFTQPTALYSLSRDAVALLGESIEKRKIQVEYEFMDVPEKHLPKNPFHQLVLNLIKNSMEAYDDLDESDFSARTKWIKIGGRLECEGKLLHFYVADNAIGMEPGDLKKMCARGFTTKEYGSGLGLHFAGTLIESLRGKIWAESKGRGQGTTICLEIPVT